MPAVEAEWEERDPVTQEETSYSGVWIARRITSANPLYYATPQVCPARAGIGGEG